MKEEQLQLTGGNHNKSRRKHDYYPTPMEVTVALMEFLAPLKSKIWEPACGNGAMSKILEIYGHDVYSTDIREDSGYGIGGIDFLTHEAPPLLDAIITNPPFDISEQFITKALKDAPLVAMLLKSQYWHARKRLALFEKHKPAWVLPLTWRPDFLYDQREDGERSAPTMEVLWTVWIKGDVSATYHPLIKNL